MAKQNGVQTRVQSVMEEPGAQSVARVYAQAFLGAAQTVGVEDALEEFASFLNDVLKPNPRFEALLLSGIVSRDDKIALINRVVSGRGSELFTNFLRVLARHDRLDLLPLIFKESTVQYEALTGRKRVQLTSARELPAPVLERIGQRLGESLSFEPILEPRIDPSLLGGIMIRIGDTVYDSSLRNRLKQLRQRLYQRSVHEIQSRRNRFSDSDGN